jgi:hypothetical protein
MKNTVKTESLTHFGLLLKEMKHQSMPLNPYICIFKIITCEYVFFTQCNILPFMEIYSTSFSFFMRAFCSRVRSLSPLWAD